MHQRDERRFERLAPAELSAELRQTPLVFLPLGAIEWHGVHLPVGLDAFTAHELCLRAAERVGGLVLPPFHYATGGGHGGYPWTLLVEAAPIEALLSETLARMRAWGVRRVVMFSGHFPPEQRSLMARLTAHHSDGDFFVTGCCVLDCSDLAGFQADHAGLFETSLLRVLRPELVRLDRLPDGMWTEEAEPYGPHRHSSSHPLYGIFGPDPRGSDAVRSAELVERLIRWLVDIAKTFSG